MPRRQREGRESVLLVFEFARWVPFVPPNVAGFFLANSQSTFRIRKVKLVQKCQKNKFACGAIIYLRFKIKNLHDAHQFFDQSTLEMVTCVFLSVKCTKYVQTMQNQFLISLFLRGKWGEIYYFSCVRCAVPAHNFTTDPPIPTKICSSLYYNTSVDWNLFEKWPCVNVWVLYENMYPFIVGFISVSWTGSVCTNWGKRSSAQTRAYLMFSSV